MNLQVGTAKSATQDHFGYACVFVLARRAVGACAGAQFDLALVEVLVELGPFLAGGLAVFLDRPELTAVVQESDIVTDDVLVEHGLWRHQISELSERVGRLVIEVAVSTVCWRDVHLTFTDLPLAHPVDLVAGEEQALDTVVVCVGGGDPRMSLSWLSSQSTDCCRMSPP